MITPGTRRLKHKQRRLLSGEKEFDPGSGRSLHSGAGQPAGQSFGGVPCGAVHAPMLVSAAAVVR
ncbi:MAG: hypothetical protein ACKOFW_17790, partial [Planctomycetaceae bacterium]